MYSSAKKLSWPILAPGELFRALETSDRGLTKTEAGKRLRAIGANKLPEAEPDSRAAIFIRQFASPLIYILFAASLIVFYLGEIADGFIILFVLLFNAVVGTIQEGRSQNTLGALKKFTETSAAVIRDDKEVTIPASELAPGDVVLLREGDKVPADARVIFSANLKVDEAALTGESVAVHKLALLPPALKVKPNLPVAEMKNMVFSGTYVLSGSGKTVVTATGLNTEIGKISKLISAIDTEIPLRANIRYLSRLIIITVSIISSVLFAAGLVVGRPFAEIFTTAVALTVSIIPEGLPVVLSVVLATGVWRMSKRNALVKKLQAVEALGQARVIAVDKTGTITKNEMVIQKLYAGGKFFAVGGVGYEPKGEIYWLRRGVRELVVSSRSPEIKLAGQAAAFSSGSRVLFREDGGEWRAEGDPTEAALQVFAEKAGFRRDEVESNYPLIDEMPFDYRLKFHAAVRRVRGRSHLAVVGAPEEILKRSSTVWLSGREKTISADERAELAKVAEGMSRDGLRVIAFAGSRCRLKAIDPSVLPALAFIGFFGMKDGLRPEVKEALIRAQSAGIRVVMITGDHRLTAEAVAREAGIRVDGEDILTGEDIERMSEHELSSAVERVAVFARVTPEHKLKIVQAYRRRREIIAMTGDGVNDAPSLVAADLGVALGKLGTEVAKEAADLVILDDNFSSIVAAVEEGRSIYKTIQKVILYLFSTSLGEVLTIGGALFLGYPLPILAGQILWLNLVTDGFLTVALAMEPKERNLLDRRFEKPSKYLVSWLVTKRMFFMAAAMMIGTLLLFREYYPLDLTKAWTVSLTVLAVFQWFNAWNCRSEDKSIFQADVLANKFLVASTAMVVFLQLAAIYTKPLQAILRTVPLSLYDWALIVPAALAIVAVEELRKFLYRRKLLR